MMLFFRCFLGELTQEDPRMALHAFGFCGGSSPQIMQQKMRGMCGHQVGGWRHAKVDLKWSLPSVSVSEKARGGWWAGVRDYQSPRPPSKAALDGAQCVRPLKIPQTPPWEALRLLWSMTTLRPPKLISYHTLSQNPLKESAW